MKILFLDDMPERHASFKKTRYGVHDITHAYTVEEAIEALSYCEYDGIFLDHDLGGTYFAPSDENSGHEVAKWIVENVDYSPIVVIHSMNPAGGVRMAQTLEDGGFNPILQPFTCLLGQY